MGGSSSSSRSAYSSSSYSSSNVNSYSRSGYSRSSGTGSYSSYVSGSSVTTSTYSLYYRDNGNKYYYYSGGVYAYYYSSRYRSRATSKTSYVWRSDPSWVIGCSCGECQAAFDGDDSTYWQAVPAGIDYDDLTCDDDPTYGQY